MTALAAGAWAGVGAAAMGFAGAGASEQIAAGMTLAGCAIALSAWFEVRRRKRRWREVERLERSLFAAAGARRKWRSRS